MVTDGYLRALSQSLWYALAGTRGGVTRIQMLQLLRERPYNVNQLHEKLNLDYKTVQHHIKVLLSENIITTDDRKKYGCMYFLSPLLEENIEVLDSILGKTGEKKISKDAKKNKGDSNDRRP